MLATEDYDSETDKLNKLAEEVGTKITLARRASGLSQWEFANRLGVPAIFVDILENGILVAQDNQYLRWNGCFFTKEELTKISSQLKKMSDSKLGATQPDSETVFFCPVTLNSNSIIDEIHTIANHKDLTSFLVQHITGDLSIKYRILYWQICLAKGIKMADSMKRRVKSVLTAYEKLF